MFKVFSRKKDDSRQTDTHTQQQQQARSPYEQDSRRTTAERQPSSNGRGQYNTQDDDRAALFAGASQRSSAAQRDPDSLADLDSEEQNKRIQGWVTDVKHETRDGSRRALERLYEIEGMAASSVDKIVQQGERISRVDNKLNAATAHANAADAHARDLQILNRPFWMPVRANNYRPGMEYEEPQVQGSATNRALAAVGATASAEERRRREEKETVLRRARMGEMAANARASADSRGGLQGGGGGGWGSTSSQTLTNEDLDRETERNLDAMGSVLARLKMTGMAMNEELDAQNRGLDSTREKVESAKTKVDSAQGRLEKVLGKKR
ncbi:hypothetical protein M427DRAFT_27105 [Gonapodya prolifera JEL478]|uniref:t-SNARE coiled-coil homology domain-containing protein n=1 Tax=Gonapodya prolifera (strain JEL478) TaxID=1344416 RepID=A0A139B0U3_GONPJ|nr:hypothetical protein M427DRAFT_27105 [Gonapodya prolifera JEL478]|eukprot:KXS22587.1 hypothetical protein M427DRAFT_27105 [Gonapodya prolifera JEL478]